MSLSPEVLQFLRGQTLGNPGRLQTTTIGRHRANTRAQGHDFLEYRAYGPGDDFRDIDWRTSGRADRIVVRQTEGEQRLGLMVAVDAGGAMNTGEGDTNRWRYTRQLVESLGWLAHRQSDALGLLAGCEGEVREIGLPISSRFTDRAQLESRLSMIVPSGHCPWSALATSLIQQTRPRETVLVISDFLDLSTTSKEDPAQAALAAIAALAELRASGRHVVLAQLLHPEELEFPWDDLAQVQFECSRDIRGLMETDARALREVYLASLRSYLDRLDTAASLALVPLVRVRTDAPITASLTDLLSALAGRHRRVEDELHPRTEASLP